MLNELKYKVKMKPRSTKRLALKLTAAVIIFGGIYCTIPNNIEGNNFAKSEYFYEKKGSSKPKLPAALINQKLLRNGGFDLKDLNIDFNFLEEILGDDINDGTMWYGINANNDLKKVKVNNGEPGKTINPAISPQKSAHSDDLLPEEEDQNKHTIVRDARYQLIANSVNHEYGRGGVKRFDELLANGHSPIAALKIIQAGGEAPKFNNIEKNQQDKFRGSSAKVISVNEYYKMHEKMIEQGVTKMPELLVEVPQEVTDRAGNKISMNLTVTGIQFKKLLEDEYIKNVANPFSKSDVMPTIAAYNDSIPRPNPLAIIKDRGTTLPKDEIKHELSLQYIRRMSLGDTDVTKIPQVIEAVKKSGPRNIPNIFHFIWFKCHHVKIHHYISWLSVYRSQNPDLIMFHTNCTPTGVYWENTRRAIGEKLIIVKRSPPNKVWGRPVEGVEHQSDVARLHILLEVGGIYLDDDVILLKSLEEFRNESIVLGEENYDALANSIIMANQGSWFLLKWYHEYKSFNDSMWSYSSCFVPWSLWHIFPETIRVVTRTMLRPNWEEIKYIYHELWDWSENYSVHLYSRFMHIVDGTEERSLKEIAVLNTTYGEIARYVLWGDKSPRDISNLF